MQKIRGVKMTKEKQKISRRKYIATVGAVAAAAAVGGVGYYLYETTRPKPLPTIRYMGYPFYFPAEAADKWKEETGVPIEVTYEDFIVLSQKHLADPTAWDVGASGRYRPLVKGGVLKEIPIEQVPRWKPDKVMEVFNNPGKYFNPAQAERFSYLLWKELGKTMWSVPIMWNYDSYTYLPEFLPYEEHGSKQTIDTAELFKPEWKGKTAMMDEAFTTFAQMANYLDWSGQMTVSGAYSSLTNDEVDKIYNYLLPIIKSGQIKSFWFKYGDIVTLLSTKEVYMAFTYQPACFDTRKAGTPAYYACLQDGPTFWYNSNYVSKYVSSDVLPSAMKFLDWQEQLYTQMLYTKQGYPAPGVYWEDYKQAMGDEFYNWFYMDKATYLPIDEVMKICWPDTEGVWTLPERLQNALFLNDVYFHNFWTGEPPRTGSPDPHGNRRDVGSVQFKQAITRYFTSPDFPDNNDYYVNKWEALKASIPV
jgi:spermidine/putrescine-binding protein